MSTTLPARVGCRLFLFILLAAAFPGCRENGPAVEVIPLEGKIEKIERSPDGTGKITVTYYSEKHKQEVAGIGLVTRETEIMIDGVAAKLSDLREGEHVRGDVRVEKKNGKKVQTALKIHVDRPKPVGGDEG